MMSEIIDPVTGEIDWPRYMARLARAFESSEVSGDWASKILAERARGLAQRQVAPVQRDGIVVLPFRLGRERYALETRFVLEVRRLADFTAIPGAPDHVIGVTNLRGDLVAVFDLRLFFALPSSGLLDRSQVIFSGRGGPEFAFIADAVEGVSEIALSEIEPNAMFEGERGREIVRGITKDAMIVLDGVAMQSDLRLGIGMIGDAKS
jgi:purine-binding chemotaxis protein CheW